MGSASSATVQSSSSSSTSVSVGLKNVPSPIKNALAASFWLEGYGMLLESQLRDKILLLATRTGNASWEMYAGGVWLSKLREHIVTTKHKARISATNTLQRVIVGQVTLLDSLKSEPHENLFARVLTLDPQNKFSLFCSDIIKEVLFFAFFAYVLIS